MLSSRVFTEQHFGRLIERLYPQAMKKFLSWQYQITIIYTHGKDISWKNLGGSYSTEADGIVSDAFLDEKRKILYGAALIDVKMICSGQRISLSPHGGLSQSSYTLISLKYKVLRVLAHELFHMVQHWNIGSEKFSKQYTEKYFQLLEEGKRENPHWSEGTARAAAHAHHPDEKIAEEHALRRIKDFKIEIDGGLWDKYIPIQDMEFYSHRKL